jgi:hypothetical protein
MYAPPTLGEIRSPRRTRQRAGVRVAGRAATSLFGVRALLLAWTPRSGLSRASVGVARCPSRDRMTPSPRPRSRRQGHPGGGDVGEPHPRPTRGAAPHASNSCRPSPHPPFNRESHACNGPVRCFNDCTPTGCEVDGIPRNSFSVPLPSGDVGGRGARQSSPLATAHVIEASEPKTGYRRLRGSPSPNGRTVAPYRRGCGATTRADMRPILVPGVP